MKKNLNRMIPLLMTTAMILLSISQARAGQSAQTAAVSQQNHTMILGVFDAVTRRPLAGARVTGVWHDGAHSQGALPSVVTGFAGVATIIYTATPYWEIWVTVPGYQTFHVTRFASDPRNPDNLHVTMRR